MDSNYIALQNRQEDEITDIVSEIPKSIADLKKLLKSNDISLVSAYIPGNAAFKRFAYKLTVGSFPSFTHQEINKEQLYQQFGLLSTGSIETEELDYIIQSQGAELYHLGRPFIDVPRVITEINTKYGYSNSVSCLNDDQI